MLWHGHWSALSSFLLPTLALILAQSPQYPVVRGAVAAWQDGQIRPDLPKLDAGKPLSRLALTARPKPISGLTSWTLATRLHLGYVRKLAASPDGKVIATCGNDDGMIRLWELETSRLIRVLVGHQWMILDLAWSPDGRYLASAGGYDKTVRIWDVHSGLPLRVFDKLKDRVDLVAWSRDSKTLLAVGSDSGWIWAYDAVRNQTRDFPSAGKATGAVAWSPDGKTVALACKEIGVRLLDVVQGKFTGGMGPVNQDVSDVCWSPDGQTLAAAGPKGIWLYNSVTGQARPVFAGKCEGAAFSPNGKLLAGCREGGGVRLWDAAALTQFKDLPDREASQIVWMPDSTKLVSVRDHSLGIWHIESTKCRDMQVGEVASVVWTPGRAFVIDDGSKAVCLWDVANCKPLRTLEHPTDVELAISSPDGKLLAVAAENAIHLWDAAAGKKVRTLEGHDDAVSALAWSPDGKSLASGGKDKKARRWDVASGKARNTFADHGGDVTCLAWAPNGQRLATGSADTKVRIWDVSTGKLVQSLSESSAVHTLTWSPDGNTLACGGVEPIVRLWSPGSNKPPKLLEDSQTTYHPPDISRLAWSANGSLLAVGRENCTVQLWNVNNGRIVQRFAELDAVELLAWSPTGTSLVTGTRASAVRFWDATTGQLRAALVHTNGHLIAFSGDGNYRTDPGGEAEVLYVAQTPQEQEMLTPSDFAAKYKWKNNPGAVKLTTN